MESTKFVLKGFKQLSHVLYVKLQNKNNENTSADAKVPNEFEKDKINTQITVHRFK